MGKEGICDDAVIIVASLVGKEWEEEMQLKEVGAGEGACYSSCRKGVGRGGPGYVR